MITLHVGLLMSSSGLSMRFMFGEGFPMFPTVFMNQVHTYNRYYNQETG